VGNRSPGAAPKEQLEPLIATTQVGHGVSISRTAASLEEARLLLEDDPDQIVAVAVSISADPASADALDDASAKLRKAGAAKLSANVLLIIVFLLLSVWPVDWAGRAPGQCADDRDGLRREPCPGARHQ
jgi:hypothetical protein